MFTQTRLLLTSLLLFSLGSAPSSASAQTPSEFNINRFTNANTIAVVRLHVAAMDDDLLQSTFATALPTNNAGRTALFATVKPILDSFREAKVQDVYLVFTLSDPLNTMPRVVVPDSESWDAEPLLALLRRKQGQDMPVRSRDGATVLGGLESQDSADSDSADFEFHSAPSAEHPIFGVLRLNANQRRALSELAPKLPPILGGGSTKELVQAVRSVQFSSNLTADSAGQLDLLVANKTELDKVEEVCRGLTHDAVQGLQSALQTRLLDNVFAVTALPDTNCVQVRLTEAGTRAFAQHFDNLANRRLAYVAENRLKQMGLAYHNFHSAYGRVLSIDHDADGEASGLSWRVRILPFIGEQELWQAFHMDEPWDSPHNRKLISRMPVVFRDPASALPVTAGRSNWVAPSSAKTLWPPQNSIEPEMSLESLQNTILFVGVADEKAPVWTKPEPFTFDRENPQSSFGDLAGRKRLVTMGNALVRELTDDETDQALLELLERSEPAQK